MILSEFPVDHFKISSGEMTNRALIEFCDNFGKTIYLSTGMSSLDEVSRTFSWIKRSPVILFQSTSIYPTPYDKVGLPVIGLYAKLFEVYGVGLSDHTPTIDSCLAAVSYGARYFEKHITLDRLAEGPDHCSSLEPDDMWRLRKSINHVWDATRPTSKVMFQEEEEKARVHKHGYSHDNRGPKGNRIPLPSGSEVLQELPSP